jgi:hypothetical protein
MNKDNEYEIPENATIRQEQVRCGNPDCQQLHGPYLYAYWKDGKRLRKKYIGKTLAFLRMDGFHGLPPGKILIPYNNYIIVCGKRGER